MSQRPSGVAVKAVMPLLCPFSRRAGAGSGSPAFSGRSQTSNCPSEFPAAIRRDEPTKVTAVTSPASQVTLQASAALSKLIMVPASSSDNFLDDIAAFAGRPDRAGADEVFDARVDAQQRVDRREQIAFGDTIFFGIAA